MEESPFEWNFGGNWRNLENTCEIVCSEKMNDSEFVSKASKYLHFSMPILMNIVKLKGIPADQRNTILKSMSELLKENNKTASFLTSEEFMICLVDLLYEPLSVVSHEAVIDLIHVMIRFANLKETVAIRQAGIIPRLLDIIRDLQATGKHTTVIEVAVEILALMVERDANCAIVFVECFGLKILFSLFSSSIPLETQLHIVLIMESLGTNTSFDVKVLLKVLCSNDYDLQVKDRIVPILDSAMSFSEEVVEIVSQYEDVTKLTHLLRPDAPTNTKMRLLSAISYIANREEGYVLHDTEIIEKAIVLLEDENEEIRVQAAHIIGCLAADCQTIQSRIEEGGGLQLILQMLKGPEEQKVLTCEVLGNLSRGCERNQSILASLGATNELINLLSCSNMRLRACVLHALKSITTENEEICHVLYKTLRYNAYLCKELGILKYSEERPITGPPDILYASKDPSSAKVVQMFRKITPRVQEVQSVACSEHFRAVLADNGDLYLWQYNKDKAQSKKPDSLTFSLFDNSRIPENNFLSTNIEILNMDVFEDRMAVVTNNGHVLEWGCPVESEPSTKHKTLPESSLIPRIVPLEGIAYVRCGSRHTLCISHTNKVYAWGNNMFGELGIDCETKVSSQDPRIIETLTDPVVSVDCGKHHSIALTASGEVWQWGYGSGLGIERCLKTPEKVSISVRVLEISCGASHNIILDEFGRVLTWGSGHGGVLGHESCRSKELPTQVVSLISVRAIKVKAGESMSACISDTGELYVWGKWGGEDQRNPTKILPGLEIRDIAVGTESTLLLADTPFEERPAMLLQQPLKVGWLSSRIGKIIKWKRYWAILHANLLYFYAKPDSMSPSFHMKLNSCVLDESERLQNEFSTKSYRFVFSIAGPKNTLIIIGTESDSLRKSWMTAIKTAMNFDVCGNKVSCFLDRQVGRTLDESHLLEEIPMVCEQWVANTSYAAPEGDEDNIGTIEKGDPVLVLEKDTNGWWKAHLPRIGEIRWIPSTLLSTDHSLLSSSMECVALDNFGSDFQQGEKLQILEMNRKDGWWMVEKADGTSLFAPATYLRFVPVIGVLTHVFYSKPVAVNYDYGSYRKNDSLFLLKEEDKGWALVVSEEGERGFIPISYIEQGDPIASFSVNRENCTDLIDGTGIHVFVRLPENEEFRFQCSHVQKDGDDIHFFGNESENIVCKVNLLGSRRSEIEVAGKPAFRIITASIVSIIMLPYENESILSSLI